MRKYFIILLSCFLLLISCQEPPCTTLPYTDISQYKTDKGFYFPQNTKTLDVYNTLYESGFDYTYYLINGKSVFTDSITFYGETYTHTESKNIIGLSLEYYENSSHNYLITFYFDDNTCTTYKYGWQYSTLNTWYNDTIPYSVILNIQ